MPSYMTYDMYGYAASDMSGYTASDASSYAASEISSYAVPDMSSYTPPPTHDGFATNLESVLRWFSTLSETERILAVSTIAQLPSPPKNAHNNHPLLQRQQQAPREKMDWPPEFPQSGDADPRWLRKWLRSLRLHKYEQSLAGLQPEELLGLNDEDLERLGIDTVGARNKLLRVLEVARADIAIRSRIMDVLSESDSDGDGSLWRK